MPLKLYRREHLLEFQSPTSRSRHRRSAGQDGITVFRSQNLEVSVQIVTASGGVCH